MPSSSQAAISRHIVVLHQLTDNVIAAIDCATISVDVGDGVVPLEGRDDGWVEEVVVCCVKVTVIVVYLITGGTS